MRDAHVTRTALRGNLDHRGENPRTLNLGYSVGATRTDGALVLPAISSHSFLLVRDPFMTLAARLLCRLVSRTAGHPD
jgi:hypothetical protein